MIRQIYFIRSIACICVILVHATQPLVFDAKESIIDSLMMLLYFGTPSFIFISEIVLAKNYNKKEIPKTFWPNRLKYLVIPYMFFSVIYALKATVFNISEFPNRLLAYVIGGWHGYFILIVLQFYLLHFLFSKYIHHFSAKFVLSISFVVNVLYLVFFNFYPEPQNSISDTEEIIYWSLQAIANDPFSYFWSWGYWLPFVGWIFYFSLAYYCGSYYDTFMRLLEKNKPIIFLLPLISGALVIFLNAYDYLSIDSSKRIDILPFTVSMIFLLFTLFKTEKPIPRIILTISRYSFGIYLMHYLYLSICNKILDIFDLRYNWFADTIFVTSGSITLSIISIYILNQFWFGKFLIGKTGKLYKKETSISSYRHRAFDQLNTNIVSK